ncbi:Hypothetical predicted protein, partial [Marmota monax]
MRSLAPGLRHQGGGAEQSLLTGWGRRPAALCSHLQTQLSTCCHLETTARTGKIVTKVPAKERHQPGLGRPLPRSLPPRDNSQDWEDPHQGPCHLETTARTGKTITK